MLFAYLHLAGAPPALTSALLASRTTAIAYETVEDERGRLPLLIPMSAIAGTMAPLMGAYHLAQSSGGRGTLLGTVLGHAHGSVVIVGDGVVGRHACDAASGLGANVTVFGITPERAAEFEHDPAVRYVLSTPAGLAAALRDADLLIGAVLRVGARAEHVITKELVASMPAGSVIVDVSIDQGGCVETSRPTTHSHPTFVAHGVTHYCVTNMPGAYPRTATVALTAATLPYVRRLAARGLAALADDPGFARGLNVHAGDVTYRAVAEALGLLERYRPYPAAPGR
jgi:alanine dehydrogenase